MTPWSGGLRGRLCLDNQRLHVDLLFYSDEVSRVVFLCVERFFQYKLFYRTSSPSDLTTHCLFGPTCLYNSLVSYKSDFFFSNILKLPTKGRKPLDNTLMSPRNSAENPIKSTWLRHFQSFLSKYNYRIFKRTVGTFSDGDFNVLKIFSI